MSYTIRVFSINTAILWFEKPDDEVFKAVTEEVEKFQAAERTNLAICLKRNAQILHQRDFEAKPHPAAAVHYTTFILLVPDSST